MAEKTSSEEQNILMKPAAAPLSFAATAVISADTRSRPAAPPAAPRPGKMLVRSCLQTLLRSDASWSIVHHFRLRGMVVARKKVVSDRLASKYKHHLSVLAGPFFGLVYPKLDSAGSTLVPKLLGTYEAEVHPTLHSIALHQFSVIVDIGCAEGHYTVGLSRLFPSAKVLAYDISPKACDLRAAMARANRADNVEVRGFCGRNELLSLSAVETNLILSNSEGYEKELFDGAITKHFRSSYFIIELHDFKDRTISRTIPPFFADTHQIEFISSVPDQEKAARYRSPLLGGLRCLRKKSRICRKPARNHAMACRPAAASMR